MERAADPNLVRDARRGDEAAFTTLLRPLLEPAFRLAVGMLQDRQLAEDAVQEAALKAWRKLDQFREGAQMQPWFLGIVANECRSTRRARWWSVLRLAAQRHTSHDVGEATAESVDLLNALKRLAADHRTVIVLYFYLDLPLEQIAAITGVSYSAVRGRLYRALRQLKADFPIREEL